MKKRLGVIGGMGPEATNYFYEQLIAHTQAKSDQEHIDTMILSHATIPDRTQAIMSGQDKELIEALTEDARMLEAAMVSNIAIPCNTSHYFYDVLQAQTAVPIIHMPRECVRYALDHYENVQKIGIMGTDGTVNAGVYQKECEAAGVEQVVPSQKRQKDIMSLIYDDVKSGRKANVNKFYRTFEELIAKGCDVIILACTELSVFKRDHELPEICLDAMDVLIRESIIRSGADYQ